MPTPAKLKVRAKLPRAYCRKLGDGTGYIVWPDTVQPRGFEQAALAVAGTANKAWEQALAVISAK
jgi:hypothetical protein